MSEIVPLTFVEQRIFLIRGQKVLLDSDLAEMYGVETKNLNKAVKRNLSRFPEDFMFQLATEESASLGRKSTRLNSSHSDRSRMPSSA